MILSAIALIVMVIATFRYSSFLADKIDKEEKQKVQQWIAASRSILEKPGEDISFPVSIKNDQRSIPIIETDDKDSITSYINLDSIEVLKDKNYLKEKLSAFKELNEPFVLHIENTPYVNKYYYGKTSLQQQIQYYPFVQLALILILVIIIIILFSNNFTSKQNTLWIGLAKETAHQLGTPVTSLQGWVEILKEQQTNPDIIKELEKDVDRLKLVSDRFGKIGYRPAMHEADLIAEIEQMIEYIRKRAPGKVHFTFVKHEATAIYARLAVPLFDWVMENLLKNALDAMEGEGRIIIDIREQPDTIIIDVIDNGKGVPKEDRDRIFAPGFSTKKRGWGVGLSLARRIIEQLHRGTLVLKQSDPGNATVFRISLNKRQSRFYQQLDRWHLLRFYDDLRNFFRR